MTIFPRLRQEAKKGEERTSWWSEGYHSARPLQGAWVQSLARELRSCMAHVAAKKKKKKKDKNELTYEIETDSQTTDIENRLVVATGAEG